MSVVLVDMDGVIADWGREWDRSLEAFGPDAAGIARHAQQTSFNLHDGCTEYESRIVSALMDQPSYYARLEPIEGALDALQAMLDAGHDVFIVTSPWVTNPTCASDKLAWIVRHLGVEWAKRVVITSDKTLVYGDVLVDDKPVVTGAFAPAWQHIIFDQPYNRDIAPRRRLHAWSDWKAVIA